MKIDKVYFEKLKMIDYSKVETDLYDILKDYGIWFIENIVHEYDQATNDFNRYFDNPEKYEKEFFETYLEDFEKSGESIVFSPPTPPIPPVNYEEYNKLLKTNTYCYGKIEHIMIVTAYILVILQEPSQNKKFNLSSMLEDYNLSNEVKKVINSYILEERFEYFIFKLINRFEKDELLAFIIFSFNFDYHLKHYDEEFNKGGNYLLSPLSDNVLNLSLKILNIKNNDSILNLYSNSGDFLINSFLSNPSIKAHGVEDYYIARDISIIKASLFSDNIYLGDNNDSIYLFETAKNITTLEYKTKQKVDKIFSNLSLLSDYYDEKKEEIIIDYRNKLQDEFKIPKEIIKESSLEWLSYILLINQLEDDGKAISIVEKNILSNIKNKEIRKYFIENGYIEAVILLPENMMINKSTSLVFIVFSKENKKIRFINASDFGKMKKLKRQSINTITDSNIDKIINLLNNDNNSEILLSKKIDSFSKNNYNLDIIENIEILPEFKDGVEFKNVIKSIIRGSQISANDLEKAEEKTPYIYLTLSNINDGTIEFESIEEYLTKIPEKQEKFCVENNSILLSKFGNHPYKFAVAQIPDGKRIIASGNFIIIKVDEKKINPWYLGALFASDIGTKILKKTYATSKLFSSLSIKKLEDAIIPLPPMEEQNEIAQKYSETIDVIKEMKKNLRNKIQSTREIFNQHNMEV